jgi:hypothetical protein
MRSSSTPPPESGSAKPSANSSKTSKAQKNASHDVPSTASEQPSTLQRRQEIPPPDPTPETVAGLEGRLNYHLAQIDTLKARRQWLFEQRELDWIILTRLQRDGLRREEKLMRDRIDALSATRRSFQLILSWHQEESETLSAQVKSRMEMEKLARDKVEREKAIQRWVDSEEQWDQEKESEGGDTDQGHGALRVSGNRL